MIQAENIGKKYMLTHQLQGKYTALRDVIAKKTKILAQHIISPFSKWKTTSSLEEFWALKNITFDIKQGDCVGIIGYNGAGKSTLLKILSRITEPTTGRVKINGLVASLLEVGTGFHPELTGRENIYLNGAILGMRKAEIERKFNEIVDFAEIEKFLDTPVKRYSSGMYVRLAFSVAAHIEPEILLVDEVLAVGDAAFQKKCLGKMRNVAQEGRTVLFVSHNMNAIRSLCRSAIWLDKGQIVKRGTTDEVVGEYEHNHIWRFEKASYVAERSLEDVKNLGFYVSRVEMQNTKGEKTNIFSYHENIFLILDVSGEPAGNNYSVEFRIFKESGEFISVGASGSYHDVYFDKKIKRVRINIGPLIFTNGKYRISLSLVSGMVRDESISRVDSWEDACSFNIIECHPFATAHDIDKRSACVIPHSFGTVEKSATSRIIKRPRTKNNQYFIDYLASRK